MNIEDNARNAYEFHNDFKMQVLHQIDEMNATADGELQDGFNTWYLDDGWVSLKGYSWGFAVEHDNPVRLDMTFGPTGPFVGYRITFVQKQVGGKYAWVNEQRPSEMYFDARQLARFGLRKLACKAGDEALFDARCSELPSEVDVAYESMQEGDYRPQHHSTM